MRLKILLRHFEEEPSVGFGDSLAHALVAAKYPGPSLRDLPIKALEDFADPLYVNFKLRPQIERMLTNFNALGLSTLSDFLELPAGELVSRFGSVALLCRQRLCGELDVVTTAWKARENIVEETFLAYDDFCVGTELLLYLMKPLLKRVSKRLYARSQLAESLSLELRLEKFSTNKDSRRVFVFEFMHPQGGVFSILSIIRERLDRELNDCPLESPVLAIKIEITNTTPSLNLQKNLFHNRDEAKERCEAVLSQLLEKLGEGRVFRASFRESYVPEQSWSRSRNAPNSWPDFKSALPLRPSRLLNCPESIEISTGAVHIRGHSYKVISWSEVEKISTDWLDDEVDRRYYKLEIENKPCVWVFQDRQDKFFLHGYFE